MDVRTQMRSAAQRNARRTAVVAGGRRLSFAEAWERGIRMANALRALDIEPQDRVGVLEDNCLESADFFLGAAIANVVRVPLYPRNARAPPSWVVTCGPAAWYCEQRRCRRRPSARSSARNCASRIGKRRPGESGAHEHATHRKGLAGVVPILAEFAPASGGRAARFRR